ncbi:hypothetical protein ABIC83_002431 [Roseateles asaccharophilus]
MQDIITVQQCALDMGRSHTEALTYLGRRGKLAW